MTAPRVTARSVRAHNPGFRWQSRWRLRRPVSDAGRRVWQRAATDHNGPWTVHGPFVHDESSGDRTGTSGATNTTS